VTSTEEDDEESDEGCCCTLLEEDDDSDDNDEGNALDAARISITMSFAIEAEDHQRS